jgi:hypothetical protein
LFRASEAAPQRRSKIHNPSSATEFARKGSLSARGLDEHAAAQPSPCSFLHDFEKPAAIRIPINTSNSRRRQKLRSRACGCASEHRVKSGAIDMPAAAVRVEEEIAMAGDRRFPRRPDAVRLQAVCRQKPLPKAQLHQRHSDFRRQRLADAKIIVGGLFDSRGLDQGHMEAAPAKINSRSGAGGSTASHYNIE